MIVRYEVKRNFAARLAEGSEPRPRSSTTSVQVHGQGGAPDCGREGVDAAETREGLSSKSRHTRGRWMATVRAYPFFRLVLLLLVGLALAAACANVSNPSLQLSVRPEAIQKKSACWKSGFVPRSLQRVVLSPLAPGGAPAQATPVQRDRRCFHIRACLVAEVFVSFAVCPR